MTPFVVEHVALSAQQFVLLAAAEAVIIESLIVSARIYARRLWKRR